MTPPTHQNFNHHDTLVHFFGAVLAAPIAGEVFVAASPYRMNGASEKSAMKQTYADSHEELANAVLAASSDGRDSYFALGRYVPHQTATGHPGRQGGRVRALKSVWMDVDCGAAKSAAGHGYATKRDAITALHAFVNTYSLPEPMYVVDSGGGIHAYWALDAEVMPDQWKPVAGMFKDVANAHGFLADPARTADVASVMRAPLTRNHKLETPRDVEIKLSGAPVVFSTLAEALVMAHAQLFGQQPKGTHITQFANLSNLLPVAEDRRLPETAEEIARVEAMLAKVPADCEYHLWRDVLWAIASTGWICAEAVAREWSQTTPQKFDEADFRKAFGSFKSGVGVGLGTLIHHAKLAGWVDILKPGEFSGAVGGDSGDILNGKVFAQLHRDKLKFVAETSVWLKFEHGVGWVHAPPGEEIRAAEWVVAKLREHAVEKWKTAPDDTKTKRLMAHVERSSSAQKIRDMIEMAKPKPGMTVRLCDLDADPMLLGVANGVLNLRTGNLLPPSPSLLVTKRCPVRFDPGATAPTLDAFIKRITRGKPTLAKFLQRLAGYVLTGAVHEQCFAFLYGLGRNGKTTYAELLRWLLGDYAVVLPTTTLMLAKRDPGAATPDLMLLNGSRLALATELEESARFAEAAIKAMTGGDTMQARNPYGLYASWTPTHKLMVVGNHRPVISGGDLGIWRRVRLIPFAETISDGECDEKLPEKLRAEGSGVLNWALAGLRDWQCQGLNSPAEVKAAGAAYQTDMDVLGQWMGDHVDTVAGVTTPTADLYRAYSAWAHDSGYRYPMTRSAFGRRLVERGIPLVKSATGIKCASGIALNNEGKHAAARFP